MINLTCEFCDGHLPMSLRQVVQAAASQGCTHELLQALCSVYGLELRLANDVKHVLDCKIDPARVKHFVAYTKQGGAWFEMPENKWSNDPAASKMRVVVLSSAPSEG